MWLSSMNSIGSLAKRWSGTMGLPILLSVSCIGSDDSIGIEQPNVILISLDTTRADRLGCYGYGGGTSPRLDRLAMDGIQFDRAIATAALTPISHASILTGLNPYQHKVRTFWGPAGHYLGEEYPTLATILRQRGWRTGAFVSAYPASEGFGLHWGFDTFDSGLEESVTRREHRTRISQGSRWRRARQSKAQRRADATTDAALEWLESSEQTFFLWLHYFDPHDQTLVPPEEITEKFEVERGEPGSRRRIYDAEIYFMDAQMGRIFDWLEASGQYDDTIIVVVADHGQGLGDHDWFEHRLIYQEQIRTPLVMRVPGRARGLNVSSVVRTVDIVPTVLDLLDIESAITFEGSSLLPLVDGITEEPRVAYSEALNSIDSWTPERLPEIQKDLLFSVIDEGWKLIYHREQPGNSELYHLEEDPAELVNVIERYPEEAKRLMSWLARSKAMEIELQDIEGDIDPEALRKLEALGYIQTGD